MPSGIISTIGVGAAWLVRAPTSAASPNVRNPGSPPRATSSDSKEDEQAFTAELVALAEKYNRAGARAAAIVSDYLEVVAVRA